MLIRAATEADLPFAVALLSAATLPTNDLTAAHLALAAEGEVGLAGVIGLERFDDVALLRSLVVSPPARGAGVGHALVQALEALAKEQGIRELWLLTIDADAYFGGLGFVARDRASTPRAIRGSTEFSRLCPADAVLMSKRL